MATVTNLRETLKEIGATINPDEDVVMLYLAGPAARDGSLEVAMPPLDLAPIVPSVLGTLSTSQHPLADRRRVGMPCGGIR